MARNKIFDITPPRKRQISESAPDPLHPDKDKLLESEPAKNPSFLKKKIIVLAVIVLLAGLALSYFLIPPKAKIELWPQKLAIKEVVILTVSSLREGENFLVGEIVEIEKTAYQNFISQSKKLKTAKAQGVIRVYNNYSTASQPLLATTRFVSDDGKLFRTPVRVVIPGAHYEGGKLAAGFIDIEVVADQPGQDYNIDASTFSIPGFVGTSKYTAFYAKSFEPMKGGVKEEVSYVSQDDLDKAREALSRAALKEITTAFKEVVLSEKYILAEESVSFEVADFKSSLEIGKEAESFSAQAKAIASALVIKETAIRDFSRDYLRGKLPSENKLIEKSLKADFSLGNIDREKNEFTMEVVISAQSYSLPAENEIKEIVKNKNIKEVENYFSGLSRVKKVKVEFWPFWVGFAPHNSERIDVILRLD